MESFCHIVLLNIHTLEIEIDKVIDLDLEIDKLIKDKISLVDENYLEYKGIRLFFKTSFDVSDKKLFLSFIRSLVFPNYQIINCEGKYHGHPDFIIKKGDKTSYVEFKYREDGLRLSQLKWFSKNKDKDCKVLFVFPIVSPSDNKSIFGKQKDGTMVL